MCGRGTVPTEVWRHWLTRGGASGDGGIKLRLHGSGELKGGGKLLLMGLERLDLGVGEGGGEMVACTHARGPQSVVGQAVVYLPRFAADKTGFAGGVADGFGVVVVRQEKFKRRFADAVEQAGCQQELDAGM